MDIKTISSKNYIPVIDPMHLQQSPDEFLAENGGFLDKVAVIAKSSSGFVHYRSSIAPSHRNAGEFFSTFTNIADSIGIKVIALVNGLADSFMAQNRGYSAIKDGGNQNFSYICPTRSSYSTYLKSIITEVLNFPVSGLVVKSVKLPHEDFCFCERCCRIFSSLAEIDRIFSLGDIKRDSSLETQWINWRKGNIARIIETALGDTLKGKSQFPTYLTVDIDPSVGDLQGALTHYGQDINIFSRFAIPTIHLSAWTNFPKKADSQEYRILIKSLNAIKSFKNKTKKDIGLYIWGITNEQSLEIVDALSEEMEFKTIFIQNHFPEQYQQHRETHLGLS
jgi:hypothetical protein